MSFLDGDYELRESLHLEFKDAANGLPNDIWETYSAFANTEGGEIVLGVHEDKSTHEFTLVGVTNGASLIDDFWNTVRNPTKVSRDITLADDVTIVSRDGLNFVAIHVPRAERDDKPVTVYDRKKKGFVAWVRRGSGDYHADDEDLRLMAYDSSPSNDRKPLERFPLEALATDTINRYRKIFSNNRPTSPWSTEPQEDFLFHIGAAAKGRDDELHPTFAGLLAFGHEYEITNCLPRYQLDYRDHSLGHDRWDDRVVSTDSDRWSGNLIDFYLTVTQKLQRYFIAPFSADEYGTSHGSRNPITESVNEALTNALVHAYYGDSSTITVVIDQAELRITNPGSLLVDKDAAIAGGISEARNPTLMRIFGFMGAGDRAGTGLNKIWATWSRFYSNEPELDERYSPTSVVISLPIARYKPSGHKKVARTPQQGSTIRQQLLAALASHPEGLSSEDVEQLLGTSKRSAQRALHALLTDAEEATGTVQRKRNGRSWTYYLNK